MKKIISLIRRYRFVSLAVLIVLAIVGYRIYTVRSNGETVAYISTAVTKGTLITSVAGTGQVSASNQVDISAKVSGDIIYFNAAVGQLVKQGALVAQIDATEAVKSVRDAQTNLDSAKLSLEKLNQPADELSLLQAEHSLIQAEESKTKAEADLEKAYDDGFNSVANAFLDLPDIMAGLNDVLFDNNLGLSGQQNLYYYADTVKAYDEKVLQYRDDAKDAYDAASKSYGENFSDYKSASRFSSKEAIELLIEQTYDTTKEIAEAIKSAINLIQFHKEQLTERNQNVSSGVNTYLDNLNQYTGTTNSHLSSLLSIKQSIQTDKEDIVNAGRTIAEKTESLAELKAGTDPLDIQSQELTIKQRENSLLDAKEKLSDYYIRAPFEGQIATVAVSRGDAVSAGGALMTLITSQKIAEISLNEVDVAKVKTGQKVTLTFDAIEDLSLTGTVLEIDTIGTVSQGIVSYNVKIGFDAQDERVKSGMSVSAEVITEVKTDVLLAPSAAVKSQDSGEQYVETLVDGQPQIKTVTTGSSNDTLIEIVTGLNEGDQIITQTTDSETSQSNSPSFQGGQQNNSMFMITR